MKPERWQKIERLYHAALEREPAQRPAFLCEVCADDEALRSEIESLLGYDEGASQFIEGPALEVAGKRMAEDQIKSMAGRQFGPYRILSQLGSGGMGDVYLAEDFRLGRQVALKLLPAIFTTDQDRLNRFKHEARATSALNHPNIITIHEIGEASAEDATIHYLVTEYVEGDTLRQRMSGRPQRRLEPSEAVDIAAQIAAALSAAHEAGIIHRDIKPENVMVRRDGIVKVLDFGLAKLIEPASPALDTQAATLARNSTEAGVVLGTPRYMSPEQARGEKVDARTDIFSLGVVLYEMVAGHAPFPGETTIEVIAAVLKDQPPPLGAWAPDAPPEMERILGEAMRKDREERYQAVDELLVDLERLKRRLEREDELKEEVVPAGRPASEGEASGGGDARLPGRSLKQSEGTGVEAAADRRSNPKEQPPSEINPGHVPESIDINAAVGDQPRREAKSHLAARGRIILVGVIFLLMSVSVGVNSYHSNSYFNSAGDPGWVLDLDGRVRTYGAISRADVSALLDGDELISINGEEVGHFRWYFRTFAGLTPGSAYSMLIRRNGLTEQLQLHTGAYHPWLRIIVLVLLPVLPAAFLLTGLAIFILRREDKRALMLAIMLATMLLGGWPPFSLLVADLPVSLAWIMTAALMVGAAGVMPVTLYFFLIFPERSPLLVRFPRLEYYLYPFFLMTAGPFGIAAYFLSTAPESFFDTVQRRMWPLTVALAIGWVYFGGALLSLVVNYRNGNPVSRRKLRVILLGTMAAFLPGSLFRLFVFLFKPSLSHLTPFTLAVIAAGGVGLLLFPLSFAYAIARHQVIPVSLMIRHSVQYLLAKNALRLIFALPLVGVALTVYANRDRTLADLLFHNSIWFYASLLAAIAFGLAYRYNLHDRLDRRFFREAYHQDKVLRELTEEVRHLHSLTEMAQRVSQKVDAALHPERLYLFYRQEGQRDMTLGYTSGGSRGHPRIPGEFELLRFLEYQGSAQNFPFPARTNLPLEEKEWLRSLGASLVVPMCGTDDLLRGLLILGPKKSEIPYTSSDRQLLEMLADQIALVYENSQLKERVAKDRRVRQGI